MNSNNFDKSKIVLNHTIKFILDPLVSGSLEWISDPLGRKN